MRWLQGLMKEVESIPEAMLVEPQKALATTERAIGEMSLPVRKLYAYCDLLVERIGELRKKAEATDSKRETGEIMRQLGTLSRRYELARSVLWQEVRHEFQEQLKDDTVDVGVRKGWKVCISENASPDVQIVKLGGDGNRR